MTKVALRAYDHEIESMIEQGHRLEEAVAHCRHILTSYPKHLDTYRLLGKAFLEAKRHDQAVDIFQRVLVAAPDDFVAHVGMSIIADDQGKLNDAIWHMERAFEVQPSNAAIQAELQRLFGRRDGTEPVKIRLTRGALAHMYVQGDLYTQAISEARAVLAADPERMDMQVLLARAYFRNGQKTEAAEICSTLLVISPYCLDANRLMAEILPGTQATEAAQEYRRRVLDLDPYAEFAKGSIFATDSVADGSVTLERLEFTGQAPGFGTAAALGLAAGLQSKEPAEDAPSWLAAGAVSTNAKESAPEQDLDLPDFLRGSGWHEVPAVPVDEAGVVEQTMEVAGEPEAEAIAGELPEWVKALAPAEDTETVNASAGRAAASSYWQQAESASPEGREEADGGAGATPDWLNDLAKGSEPPPQAASSALWENPILRTDTATSAPVTAAPVENDNGLAWLEGLAEKHGAKPEELITPPSARKENPPEWIENLGQAESGVAEGWRPVDAELREHPDAGAAPVDQPAPAAGASLDWLAGLAAGNAFAKIEKPEESDEAPFTGDKAPTARPAALTEEEFPDWLADKLSAPAATPQAIAREQPGLYESIVDLPDWLADLDESKKVAAAEETPPREAPGWLQPAVERPEPPASASHWRAPDADALPKEKPVAQARGRGPMQPEAVVHLSGEAAPPARQALPARTRPAQPPVSIDAPSLEAAKAEMARGNIAAALDVYGRLIRKGKSLSEIIRELREALYRYPVEVPIWQALGDAYMRDNRLQEALDAYTKAEELLR